MQEFLDIWWMPLSIAIVGLPLIAWGFYAKWNERQHEKYNEWKKQQDIENAAA